MSTKMLRLFALLIFSVVTVPTAVFAAAVELENGDRLHGEVLHFDSETLVLEHPDFGQVEISSGSVATVDGVAGSQMLSSDDAVGGSCCVAGPCDVAVEEEVCDYDPICVQPWCGRASVGFSDKTGNSTTQTLAVSLNGTRKTLWNDCPWTKWEAEIKYDYEEEEGEDTVNKGRGKLEYERRVAPHLALRAAEDISFDQRKDLRSRLATTGGIGYYILDGDCLSWELRLGLARVDAHYSDSSNNEHTMNLPMGWEFEWTFYKCWLLTYEMEYSPDLSEWERFRFYNDVELSIPITDCWSYNTEYEYVYLSHPASGKEHYDGNLKMKICYRF